MRWRDRSNSVVAKALDNAGECSMATVQVLREKTLMMSELIQQLPTELRGAQSVIEIETLLLESSFWDLPAQRQLYPDLCQQVMECRKPM